MHAHMYNASFCGYVYVHCIPHTPVAPSTHHHIHLHPHTLSHLHPHTITLTPSHNHSYTLTHYHTCTLTHTLTLTASMLFSSLLRLVRVLLEAAMDTDITLVLSYVVSNASWTSAYDVRVFSNVSEKSLKVRGVAWWG